MTLGISGQHVIDEQGRTVLLRGCSLASAKLPNNLPSHSNDLNAFYDHRNVSFVDKPLPLKEVRSHLQRLKECGFNCLRLALPWEAIEHSGPGQYDEAYLAYLQQLVRQIGDYGLNCLVDCHRAFLPDAWPGWLTLCLEDVWSRLCGGSGAPGWTLELAGMDIEALHGAYGAHLHSHNLSAEQPPPSAWPTGYLKLASATMFTLFWAGDELAPLLRIPVSAHAHPELAFPESSPQDTVGISTFLQSTFFAAMSTLASRLEDCPHFLGFEALNEPHPGFLQLHSFYSWNELIDLHYFYCPSPIQAMALGAGVPQTIPVYRKSWPQPTTIAHYHRASPTRSLWKETCLWQLHGVWKMNQLTGQPVVLKSSYFERNPLTGRPFDFYQDHWFPFINRFADRVTASTEYRRKHWLLFAGAIPNEVRKPQRMIGFGSMGAQYPPEWPTSERPHRLVYAPHFYDLHTLFSRTFGNITFNVQRLSRGGFPLKCLHIGRKATKSNYVSQTSHLKHADLPSYFSEIGTTFETNLPTYHDARSSAKRRRLDSRWQLRSLDCLLSAMDSQGLGYAIWNYNPENEAYDMHSPGDWGDSWNGEDFSFAFKSLADGQVRLRCSEAVVRPYPMHLAGIEPSFQFDMFSLDFDLSFSDPPADYPLQSNETLLFLPLSLYGEGKLMIDCSAGTFLYDQSTSILKIYHGDRTPGLRHSVRVRLLDSPEKRRRGRLATPDIDLEGPWLWLVALVAAAMLAVVSRAIGRAM